METGARTTLLYLLRKICNSRDMYVQVCMFVHTHTHTHTHIYTDHTHRHGASAGTLEEISKQATNKRRQILRADPFRSNSASVIGVS